MILFFLLYYAVVATATIYLLAYSNARVPEEKQLSNETVAIMALFAPFLWPFYIILFAMGWAYVRAKSAGEKARTKEMEKEVGKKKKV